MGEGPEINERWKFMLELYQEILGCTFTLFLFLLPLSPFFHFFGLLFSFLLSLSLYSPFKKIAEKAARCISVFHTFVSGELNDLLLNRFLW